MTNIDTYTNLITSEHNQKAKFVAMTKALIQPFVDIQNVVDSLPLLYDLDNAIGQQLDRVGEWVGRTRYLSLPLTGVYFSFDDAALGFDMGTWFGPFDPVTGLVALPDDAYRTLLRAVIASNHWDGTIPGAYAAWDTLFAGTGFTILIQDNEDMSMLFALLGAAPDAVTKALLKGGYLSLKPAGVRISAYVVPSVPGAPLFGFDAQNSSIAGFDTGCWGEIL